MVSALNFAWQPSHAACDTISRASGVPVPLGTKLYDWFAAKNVFALSWNTRSVCRDTWIQTTCVSFVFAGSYATTCAPKIG